MKTSDHFMLLFRLQPNFDYRPSKEELIQQRQKWGEFFGNIAIQEKLVSTYRLGFEGTTIADDLSESGGVHLAENQMLSGNLVVKANSLEEAVTLAKNCPILEMNGTVEVRSIIPMES
ncbi:MAG: YciI family protein [Bacteroidota bacterium]